MSHFDVAYNDLIDRVLTGGSRRETRAKLESTGKHIDAITLFGHDGSGGLSLVAPAIHDEFPLLTTKRVWFHGVKHELLWMLSGSTNVRDLQAAKVRIWNQWADENGELGAVYGAQWRAWNGKVDQIQGVLEGIAAVKADPHASVGRRIILTGWNVEKIPEMALPPCHTLAQWDVRPAPAEQSGCYLDCVLYMRSCDAFLGLPFNAAQYALLTTLLANLTGMTPGALTIHFGNLHVYSNHQESLLMQRGRDRHPAPRVRIIGEIDPTLRSVDPDAIDLQGYVSGDPLPGEVAV
jgi:thymidylate synthase